MPMMFHSLHNYRFSQGHSLHFSLLSSCDRSNSSQIASSLPSPSSNIEAWPYGTSLPFASLLHLGNTFLMTNSSRRIDHTFTSKITEEPLEYDLKLPKNHWNDIKSLVKSAGIRSKMTGKTPENDLKLPKNQWNKI